MLTAAFAHVFIVHMQNASSAYAAVIYLFVDTYCGADPSSASTVVPYYFV